MSNRPERASGLEINEMEDGFILYDPRTDRVHFLNHSCCFVLEYCNGKHSVAEIAEIMKQAWKLESTPLEEVAAVVRQLTDEGLLREA